MNVTTENSPSPPAQMTLRPATADDKPAMLQVMAPYKNRHFPDGLQPNRVRIAELGGEMVGFVGWEGNEVLALYVAQDWRRKGLVGAVLLAAAETTVRKAGHASVRILIDADETNAHRFYTKHDYETDWNRDNEDVAWMTKTFR